MFNTKTQGNDHKVAGTQIREKVAEICSKYGIEYNDNDLRYDKCWDSEPGRWEFTPFLVEIRYPGQVPGFHPKALAGMYRITDYDYGDWCPMGVDMEDFEPYEIAAFNEIALVMSDVEL